VNHEQGGGFKHHIRARLGILGARLTNVFGQFRSGRAVTSHQKESLIRAAEQVTIKGVVLLAAPLGGERKLRE
jgi:hypothetical protein